MYRAWHWASSSEPRPHEAPGATETTGAQQAQKHDKLARAVPFLSSVGHSFIQGRGTSHRTVNSRQCGGGHPHGAQSLQSCTYSLLHPRARALGQQNRTGKQRLMEALTDISISVCSPNHHSSVKYIDGSRHWCPHLISIKASVLTKGPGCLCLQGGGEGAVHVLSGG